MSDIRDKSIPETFYGAKSAIPKAIFDKWLHLLRTTKHPQCYGRISSRSYVDNKALPEEEVDRCALGILGDACELNGVNFNPWEIARASKINWQMWGQLQIWNDNERLTFPEIADRLEEIRDQVIATE